jgi:CRISPR/Cas system-associated endonuclease Cas1
LNNGKGTPIAKNIVTAKLHSENLLLEKYGLRQHDIMRIKEMINELGKQDLGLLRKQLTNVEGRFTANYFNEQLRGNPFHLTKLLQLGHLERCWSTSIPQ